MTKSEGGERAAPTLEQGQKCKRCAGVGSVDCPSCDGDGFAREPEPPAHRFGCPITTPPGRNCGCGEEPQIGPGPARTCSKCGFVTIVPERRTCPVCHIDAWIQPEPPAQPTPEPREECPFTAPAVKCIRNAGHNGQHDLAFALPASPAPAPEPLSELFEEACAKLADAVNARDWLQMREAKLVEALREADEYTWHTMGCPLWEPSQVDGIYRGECDCGYKDLRVSLDALLGNHAD